MRRLIFVVAIVLAVAYWPATLTRDASPHTARNASACCSLAHRTPATHNPQGPHAQFQDASYDATLTTPNGDRLAALDTITCLQPGTSALRQPETDCVSPFNHTPRYLRTFVLLI